MSAIVTIVGRVLDLFLHPVIERALAPTVRRVDDLERDGAALSGMFTDGEYVMVPVPGNPSRN